MILFTNGQDDPAWRDRGSHLHQQSVRRRRKTRLLERAREVHRSLGEGAPAADLIREDRDAR